MGLISAEEYKASLNDGREVYYQGEKVENVVTHHDLGVCVDLMAIDYKMAEDPKYREMAVMTDPGSGQEISRYYYKPQNAEDLLKAHELIVKATELGDGYIPLAHDIGADALNAINNFKLQPTSIVHSGGGYHAYWVLNEPIKVTKDNIKQIESINKTLSKKLGIKP